MCVVLALLHGSASVHVKRLWYGMVWHGMVWYGMVWYGMVWYGMVWYGVVHYACRDASRDCV